MELLMFLYKHSPTQTKHVIHAFPELPLLIHKSGNTRSVHFVFYSSRTNKSAELIGWLQVWKEWYQMARIRYGVDFVNLKLTEEDRGTFTAWAEANNGDVLTYLEQLIGAGYKLSLNEDEENHCFIAAITGGQDNRDNRNKCMISRAPDLLDALQLALYKHFVLCNGGNWGDSEKQDMTWG
jgi:hypothetical protein